jgi:malate dehydrogenase (oxaloacetate-decarboxylating)
MGTKQHMTPWGLPPQVPRGIDLLSRQVLNKGTAFTVEERSKLGWHGFLSTQVEAFE